ncbi:MAG TPA: hypothetical protein VFI03_06860 [Solirubrobacterales bacterium]|nr:hypothetical protein [Solirubrobacterales bacterium]
MPSARRNLLPPRFAVAACAGSLLLGAVGGCSTTQEKAAEHRAESKRILEARAERQAEKKRKGGKGNDKPHQNGGKKQ